jgi:hypothetical protein
MFNLATINCEKQTDDTGKVSLECKVTQAVVWASSGKPDPDNPNCSLDLTSSSYPMKELQRGVLTGIETGTALCIKTILTIDRNTKRVYLSFTKTKDADRYDQIKPGTCGMLPRTQVLGREPINLQGVRPARVRYCPDSVQIPQRSEMS